MNISRRQLLKSKIALAISAITGISLDSVQAVHASLHNSEPNVPIDLTQIHAYAEKAIDAGTNLNLRVSSQEPYDIKIYRLHTVDGSDLGPEDELIGAVIGKPANPQPIAPGSYIHVDNNLPDVPMSEITLECWIRPSDLNEDQGILTQHTYPNIGGVGLFLTKNRQVQFYAGNGGAVQGSFALTAGAILNSDTWYHIVATWKSADEQAIYIDGIKLASKSLGINGNLTNINPGIAPLRIGAYGSFGKTSQFFTGDIAMPVIYSSALSINEINIRKSLSASQIAPTGNDVLAAWPFDEEIGSTVSDASTNNRDGEIINHATWMIGGPSFDASAVERYSGYNPDNDADRGHSIRFARDDLYDCNWDVTDTFHIPSTAKSGIYLARLSTSSTAEYDVSFVVRKSASRPKSPILVIAATNTWAAYNRVPFDKDSFPSVELDSNGLEVSVPPIAPRFSFYTEHVGGKVAYQVGMNIPNPASGPFNIYLAGNESGMEYSHLVRAERHVHRWLDDQSYEYDVATDSDLSFSISLLSGYQTVMIVGHSEYWTDQAYSNIDNYLKAGGNALVLSGNTMLWRTSLNSNGSILECRKYGTSFRGTSSYGELWHSGDINNGDQKQLGGLMRDIDQPCWKILGLEPSGQIRGSSASPVNDIDDLFSGFSVTNPSHTVFTSPNPTGLDQGEQIGLVNGLPLGVGHEWDTRVETLQPGPTPNGAPSWFALNEIETLADSKPNITFEKYRYYHLEALGLGSVPGDSMGQIVYWPRSQGGKVFYAGSIASGWALNSDSKFSVTIDNVLDSFGVKPKVSNGNKFVSCNAFSGNEVHVLTTDPATNIVKTKRRNISTWLPGLLVQDEIGGIQTEHPLTTAVLDGVRLNAFCVANDGNLKNKWWHGAGWLPSNGWEDRGSGLNSEGFVDGPTAMRWGVDNYVDIVARDSNNNIQLIRWTGSNWSVWHNLGGAIHNFSSPVSMCSWHANYLNMLAVGVNGEVRNSWSVGSNSIGTQWQSLNKPANTKLIGPIATTANFGSQLHLFALGEDSIIYHKCSHTPNWLTSQGWESLGTKTFQGSLVATTDSVGRVRVFGIGKSDGHVYNKFQIGNTWSGWQNLGGEFMEAGQNGLPDQFGSLSGVARPNSSDQIDLFATRPNGVLYTKRWSGVSWVPSVSGAWEEIST